MLDLHQQDAREARANPILIQLICELLLDAVVSREIEARRVIRLERGVRRRLAEAIDPRREMPVIDHQRVARIGMCVEPLGEQNPGPEVHVAPPELREPLRANAQVLHILRFLPAEIRDRRNFLGQLERNPAIRRHRHVHGLRIQVSWLPRQLLPFPVIGRELQRVAIAPAKGFVAVHERLHAISPWLKLPQRRQWIPEGIAVHDRRSPRTPPVHVHPGHLPRRHRVAHLKARLGGRIRRDVHEDAPIDRGARARGWEGHGDAGYLSLHDSR